MRTSPLLAFVVFTHTASAGICWSSMEKPGRCYSVLREHVTREECCSSSGSAAWSEEDLSNEKIFFWRVSTGGAKCTPCEKSCAELKCGAGKVCVVRDGQARCVCAAKCDRLGPVCGTDGRTYRSLCRLRRKACNKPHKQISVAYNGACQVGSCSQVHCSSGKRCVLDRELNTHCVRCGECNMAASPLCGADGRTYAGICAIRRAACELGKSIPLAYKGSCRVNVTCADIECGSGQRCAEGGPSGARCVTCDNCTSASPARRRDPTPPLLCGSDGRTHKGWCEVQRAMCITREVVDVVHLGPCLGNATEAA